MIQCTIITNLSDRVGIVNKLPIPLHAPQPSRSFLLLSDQGEQKMVQCGTAKEFMNVLEVVTSNLDENQIEYADLAVA